MKKRIKEKLNSQKGASITFALLLFLVCAVISSIVIAAGSAAAGRMSGLARMDRRYYAVTSAAELLVDQIDGKTVSVVSNKEDGKTEDSGEEASIIRDASEQLVSAYASGASGSDIVRTRKFKLTSGSAINNAALSCLIEEKLGKDGMLYFEVKNNDAEEPSGGTYTLMVAFSSNVKESASDSRDKTKKTTITWKLHSIRKA